MKKFVLIFVLVVILSAVLTLSIGAVTTYDDAPSRTNIQVSTEDVMEFYDGFVCPSAYVFKDVVRMNDRVKFADVCDFTYINSKTGKQYTYADVKGFDIPAGVQRVGLYAGSDNTTLKWISFPDTIKELGNAIFQNATGIEECVLEFPDDFSMTNFPPYMFFGCKNLKAFSMPDCFTKICDVGTFSGCTNLTAVYLSKNLTTWVSGGGGSRNATFDDCYNMYFVNEAFTYDNIPEKPTVYYFPKNLESITNQSVMRDCKNLNDVLVFGEKLTQMPNYCFFQGSPKNTVVFLGDMTNVNPEHWGTTRIFFANKNDIDATTAGLTKRVGTSNGKAYYCFAADNTTHLAEKTVDVEASCEVDAGVASYCYCGYEISKDAIEGTALTHDYDYFNNDKAVLVAIAYESFGKNGTKTVTCANCGEDADLVAYALFVCQGYSSKELGQGALAIGYKINEAAINEYTTFTGKSIDFGVFAATKDTALANGIVDEKGNFSSNVLGNSLSKYTYSAIVIKVTGFETDAQKNTKLVMGAYVIVTGEDGVEISYIQATEPQAGETYGFASYNNIVTGNLEE